MDHAEVRHNFQRTHVDERGKQVDTDRRHHSRHQNAIRRAEQTRKLVSDRFIAIKDASESLNREDDGADDEVQRQEREYPESENVETFLTLRPVAKSEYELKHEECKVEPFQREVDPMRLQVSWRRQGTHNLASDEEGDARGREQVNDN